MQPRHRTPDTKLANVQHRLDQLTTALRAELRQIVDRARTLDPANCTTNDICHIQRPGNTGPWRLGRTRG